MPYIGKTPLTGAYQLCDTITTSATATYNLLVGGSGVIPGSANNCIVSLNGVVQAPVGAFTVSGSTITFASTLSATDVIDFILILGNVFDIGKPTDGSVTNASIANSTINLTTKVTGVLPVANGGTGSSTTAGGFKSMQVFSTAGSFTYTKPSGINLIKVYITGGGGGGGKGGASEISGGGGAAGGTAIKVINATSITTETVTIGAGGASETAGSTSSFGSHCSATGGEQGLNAGALAGDTQGGVGSSGDINLYGQAGGGGADDNAAKTGGLGGSSFWGGGGYGIYNTTGLVGYHGGGGGGGQRATANLGGAGGAGICVVEEYS